MFTDSHCHLAASQFPLAELTQLIQRALENKITRIITLATNLQDLEANLLIADSYPEIYACLGIHPCDVADSPSNIIKTLSNLASHQKCVAIGETGLDYFHPAPDGLTERQYREKQHEFLHQHFSIARTLQKNIVIHTRDKNHSQSFQDALNIYKQYSNDVQAVFHCFLGPWENAKKVLDMGGILSFTGIATFKSAKECLDCAIKAPKYSFMLETDSPYLAPVPHRGKRNEPSYVSQIAQHIASSRGETEKELSLHTEHTVANFFQL